MPITATTSAGTWNIVSRDSSGISNYYYPTTYKFNITSGTTISYGEYYWPWAHISPDDFFDALMNKDF